MGAGLFEACRGQERSCGSVVQARTVVDARGRVLPDATVRVSWTGYAAMGGGDIDRNNPNNIRELTDGFETTTSSTGFFRFCGVPAGTRLRLYAASGEVTSDPAELQIPDYETGALRVLELDAR